MKYTLDAETGDLTQFDATWDNSSGSIAASMAQKAHGLWGFALDHDTDGAYCAGQKNFSATEVWARHYFWLPAGLSLPAYGNLAGLMVHDNTTIWVANNIASVNVRRNIGTAGYPTGFYINGSGITTEDVAATISAEAWHYVEIHWKKSPTVGVLEVWFDGVRIVNQTGLNTDTYSALAVVSGNASSAPAVRATVYTDDFVVSDEGYIGPVASGGPTSIYLRAAPSVQVDIWLYDPTQPDSAPPAGFMAGMTIKVQIMLPNISGVKHA